MNWYVASLLFEATHSQPSSQEGIWEDRLILLRADTVSAAHELAQQIGQESAAAYAGQAGDHIVWQFRQIERVFALPEPELQSGMEVFSRFLKASEVASLLSKLSDGA